MKYQKPVVINLGAAAQAAGQGPLGCYDGGSANGMFEICFAGSGASDESAPCRPGGLPGAGDCIGGGDPWFCMTGGSGVADSDGCRVGPSAA